LFEGDDDFDAEEVEDMRKDDLRPCTRDGLFVEQEREWLLDQGKQPSPAATGLANRWNEK